MNTKPQSQTHKIIKTTLLIQGAWGLNSLDDPADKRSITRSKNNKSRPIIVLTCPVSRRRTTNKHVRSKQIVSQLRSITGTLLRRWLIEMHGGVTGRQSPLTQVALVQISWWGEATQCNKQLAGLHSQLWHVTPYGRYYKIMRFDYVLLNCVLWLCILVNGKSCGNTKAIIGDILALLYVIM